MKKVFFALVLALGLGSIAQADNGWHGEDAYLRCNPDVAQAVRRGDLTAWEHYQQHGQYENRVTDGSCQGGRDDGRYNPPRRDDRDGGRYNPPPRRDDRRDRDDRGGYDRAPRWWNEGEYLRCNDDVRRAVRRGEFRSGYHHYVAYGERERRALTCR
ncbi:MAG: hypothetical protein EOP04_17040 [Proteobacteria bacterium]|nr:MAG: hypothetical protein EOP04_17040 [Pseudomonadota bacterium]